MTAEDGRGRDAGSVPSGGRDGSGVAPDACGAGISGAGGGGGRRAGPGVALSLGALVVCVIAAGVILAARAERAGDPGSGGEAKPGASRVGDAGAAAGFEVRGPSAGDASWEGDGLPSSGDVGRPPQEAALPVYVGIVDAMLSASAEGLDPGVLAGLDVPDVCRQRGVLVSTARIEGLARASWTVPGELAEVTASVLEQMRDEGLDLRFGSYLDLFDQVWGGVVLSERGWAEIVTVDARGEEGLDEQDGGPRTCLVSITRIDEDIAAGLSLEGDVP